MKSAYLGCTSEAPEIRYLNITALRHFTEEYVLALFLPVGTQRAYFELKYFKIVIMRDAKYSLKMAAEKWRQKFPFLNALYS